MISYFYLWHRWLDILLLTCTAIDYKTLVLQPLTPYLSCFISLQIESCQLLYPARSIQFCIYPVLYLSVSICILFCIYPVLCVSRSVSRSVFLALYLSSFASLQFCIYIVLFLSSSFFSSYCILPALYLYSLISL